MTQDDYKLIGPTFPKQPGVYRFLSEVGEILYVGKAKNLKNRLSSYFTSGKNIAFRTKTMVRHASTIEYTIVDTEHDALLLESTLIKKNQPRYNVMLKDGKSYTYICVKKERFPRVFFTRKIIRDGSEYFGPYTSKYRARIVLDMIKNLFQLRTCNLNLKQDQIDKGKFKICLEYHIKNCLGPCEGHESEEDYNVKIGQVKNMLKGHFGKVKSHLKHEMQRLSEQLDFEGAHRAKIKFEALTDYQGKSTVVSATIKDVDVFSIAVFEKNAFVNYLKVINGAVINAYTIELTKNLNEEKGELLSLAIIDLREKFNSVAPEIIVPFDLLVDNPEVKVTVPLRGEKRKLLELSEKNVNYFVLQKKKDEATYSKKETSAERILKTLQSDLQLTDVPMHIECFDNSNIQGSNPVASCVVFKNAKPSKKDYRHFHIKTVVGPDDFASMEEVVFRRYKRLIQEDMPLPQLVIIDGGKGQLSSAMKSMVSLGVQDKIVTIGIAKKLEEIYFPGDSIPLYINKKSESLKLIQHLRNEAHRFAINFHRDLRSKNMIQSTLTEISGIGDKTAEMLLSHFGSVKKVAEASEEELLSVINLRQAKMVRAFFHAEEE